MRSTEKSINMKNQTRYPNYNVLDKWSSPDWDDQTREVIKKRLEEIPPIRFFTEAEVKILAAVAECIIPQTDRTESEKVPIVPRIDEKLFKDERDGYRYEDLPEQREAWRIGLKGIDDAAREIFGGKTFIELDSASQDTVLKLIGEGKVSGGVWEKMSAERFFKSVLCSTVIKIYYSHPLAWNEIGYNGPSSPRGHFRKWEGGIDPWEAQESD